MEIIYCSSLISPSRDHCIRSEKRVRVRLSEGHDREGADKNSQQWEEHAEDFHKPSQSESQHRKGS